MHTTAAGHEPETPPEVEVAGYRIRRLLGEGGMGRVYLAEQQHPARQVALKLMRGLHRQARQRFQREAELLAALEHPGIARLYAAGEVDLGSVQLPWLALEYVEGVDLVAHAEARQLDLRARLALLIAICRAVHYAHGRGVIHRDLKPGNILVDADGGPRVLDFGIARLLDDPERMTEGGQLLGTLPYMSPEQLMHGTGADVAGDVYSLGVIAYELIARRLPHPRLSTSTLFEALDIVRREVPAPLGQLEPRARGDLECVVTKALSSDPQRRYASVAEFAADLQRVLDHRAVEARAPSAAYLATRFVRRHRALSVAAALVMLSLLGATLVSLRFAVAEAQARSEADAAAAEATTVNAFLERMLTAADPSQAQGRDVSVATVLDQAEAELAATTPPVGVHRAILATLADTRSSLGQYPRALELTDQALALDGDDSETMQGRLLRRRATVLTELGRFGEAREAIAAARAVLPADADATARLGLALSAARLNAEAGDPRQAEAGYRALLDEAAALPLPQPAVLEEVLLTTRSNLSALLRDKGALEESLALTRGVLEARRQRHGERDPRTLASRHKLVLALGAMGRHAEAESEARAVLAEQTEVLGASHLSTLTTQQSLANTLLGRQALDEAEALTRSALAGLEAQLGPTHAQTLSAMNSLAYLLEERGKLDQAEAQYRDILARLQHDDGAHPETLSPRNNLAMLLLEAGRFDEARAEFETLLAATAALLGEAHPYHAIFSSNYGLCLHRAGALREATAVLESAHGRLAATVGAEHERTRTAFARLEAVRADANTQASQ